MEKNDRRRQGAARCGRIIDQKARPAVKRNLRGSSRSRADASSSAAQHVEGGHIVRAGPSQPSGQVAPQRLLPSHLPPGDVGTVLAALGVEEDERGRLYWWRREHKAELADLLARLKLTAEQLRDAILTSGQRQPDLRRIADIAQLVRG